MNPLAPLVGNWSLNSVLLPEEIEYLHVSVSGRIVHFVISEAGTKKRFPMALWIEHSDADTFRVRPRPLDKGWTVELRLDGDNLEILKNGRSFLATRAPSEELPSWFSSDLEKTMERMDRWESECIT